MIMRAIYRFVRLSTGNPSSEFSAPFLRKLTPQRKYRIQDLCNEVAHRLGARCPSNCLDKSRERPSHVTRKRTARYHPASRKSGGPHRQ